MSSPKVYQIRHPEMRQIELDVVELSEYESLAAELHAMTQQRDILAERINHILDVANEENPELQ